MVSQIEVIIRGMAHKRPSEFTNKIIKAIGESRKNKDDPEVLEEIVVIERDMIKSFHHTRYIHDQNTGTFFNRATGVQTVLYDRLNTLLTTLEVLPGTFRTVEELIHAGGGKSRGSVRKNIHDLRDIVEEDPKHPQIIITKRGVGYMFNDERRKKVAFPARVSRD